MGVKVDGYIESMKKACSASGSIYLNRTSIPQPPLWSYGKSLFGRERLLSTFTVYGAGALSIVAASRLPVRPSYRLCIELGSFVLSSGFAFKFAHSRWNEKMILRDIKDGGALRDYHCKIYKGVKVCAEDDLCRIISGLYDKEHGGGDMVTIYNACQACTSNEIP